jgi:uncharacterized phage protein (TIGR02218 family)
MKTASAGLITILASGSFQMVDLYTITLQTGTILRYASADYDFTVGGHTYAASSSLFTRGKTSTGLGIAVAQLDVTVHPLATELLGSLSWWQAAISGVLDGARLQVDRCFYQGTPWTAGWPDVSAGTLNLFGGRIADVQVSRTEITLSVKSDLELLNIQLPRNVYQASCLHELYDAGCTLLKATFQQAGFVTSTDPLNPQVNGLGSTDGYYDLGYLTMTSGLNAGLSRPIKHYDAGTQQAQLLFALPNALAINDTFTAVPGCDKQQATCSGKFSNLVHFRGFPYIPTAETLI